MLCVGALVDRGGGGGVGKDMEMGRGLLCGMTTSLRSPLFSSLVLLVEVTRFPAGAAVLIEDWRTLLARPSAAEGLGRPSEGALLLAASLLCAIEIRAAAALVVRTTGAAFSFFLGDGDVDLAVLGFSGDVWTSGMSLLTFSTASSSSSSATIGSSALEVGEREPEGGVEPATTACSRWS